VEQLVGREAELHAVHDALARPAPVGIVLEGEAGIGKTALWRAGVGWAAANGLRTLVARPAEAETGLSHAALGDLLTPLAEELGGELPEPQRHALDVALLRAAPGATPVSPRAVGSATLAALRLAAKRAPLMLAVDDIQWLDPASADALRFALRRLEDEPVVLLATCRRQTGDDALELGLHGQRVARVDVGPLDADALHWLLQSRLDATIPRPALARLAELSGGNPYHALELARAAMRHSGGEALSPDLPLPETIYAVLQERLRDLPSTTVAALGTVAAMSRPTLVSASAAVDAGALDPAFAAGILREERSTIRFDHPLLAEAAYRMLAPSMRSAVHERLAELSDDAEERARHLAAGTSTPDGAVAVEIERGAEAAAARGARSAAGELLEAAARVEPDAELGALRRIAAVGHHMAAADGRRAVALSTALIEELPGGPLRARAMLVRATQEGRLDELLELARQAEKEAGPDRELQIEALATQGVILVLLERHDEAGVVLRKAQELCTPDVRRDLRVQVLADLGDLAHHRGDPDAVALLREAVELEAGDVIPNANWSPTTGLGNTLTRGDRLDEARPLLEDRYRRALEAGDEESIASLSIFLSELEQRGGDLERARRLADEGMALQEGSYGEDAQGASAYGRAMVAAYQGDVELARELAERGLAQSEAQEDAVFAGANRAALGFLEFSLGDNAAALERLQPLMERFLEGGSGDPGRRQNIAVPDAIEALVALGRLREAEKLLAAWERAGQHFDRPRIRATAARSRALLAAARGRLDDALGHAEAALEHHRELPVPFERARTLIVLGTLHRRAKHKAAARAALEEASEILDGMGARLWAKRARAELGRIGGRAAANGLTPTEQRVADLVAEGRSNKEVAGELFVSVRTVEANLTRVYAKLGIRSRTELASRRGR
jgi:DNA-binding CsgD family transcriptional regulator